MSQRLPEGCVGRCQDCGMPLRSWDEHHTWDDCEWWRATQPMRNALVGVGQLQREIDAITQSAESDSE